MTPALDTLHGQRAHYAAVRARLWPVRRQMPPVLLAPPKLPWRTPRITDVTRDHDGRVAEILAALAGRPLNIRTIQQATASAYGMDVRHLIGPRRNLTVAEPRQIAMTLCRRLLDDRPSASWKKIGLRFNRDHSTAVHAVVKFGALVERVIASQPDRRE